MVGETIDPCVSVPIPNATQPAAVAEPGPADEPLEPCVRFQGFLVWPRYQLSPCAKRPVASFAMSTAPASRRRMYTSESTSMTWSWCAFDPHVVFVPRTAKRSLMPRSEEHTSELQS